MNLKGLVHRELGEGLNEKGSWPPQSAAQRTVACETQAIQLRF